jgi:hypothetical protein
VELYLYSLIRLHGVVLRDNFTFTLIFPPLYEHSDLSILSENAAMYAV